MANYGADWFNNVRCGVQNTAAGLVHLGFLQIFDSMREELKRFVNTLIGDSKNSVHTIHCIGHSLGGAIATLTADWAKRTTGKQIMLYTFGAPKPGFEDFAGGLTRMLREENIHHMYHTTDPVPMAPLYPFTHPPLPGWGHFKASAESVLTADAHSIKRYRESAENATWDSLKGPAPMTGFDQIIENWLKSDGPEYPSNADTWERIDAGLRYIMDN
jgi:hypothetical protein